MEQNLSQVPPLDIGGLDFHESHPDTYTLLKLDASRLSHTEKNPWERYEHFREIGQSFLKESLTSRKDMVIGKTLNANYIPGQYRTKRLLCTVKHVETSNGERRYYVVSLYQKKMNHKSINFINYLNESEDDDERDDLSQPENFETTFIPGFVCQASLVLFLSPESRTEAMAYGFGNWRILIEHSCIIPKWGLRVFGSSTVFEPEYIKDVKSTYYRTSNLSTQTSSVQKPTRIENFGLEVGSQGLGYVRGGFNKTYNLTHLVRGDNYLQFSVKCERNQEEERDLTIKSLERIASHFQALTDSEDFTIHERMQELIDQEVKNKDLIVELTGEIDKIFASGNEKDVLLVDKSLWGFGGKNPSFGLSKSELPLEALRQKQNQIETYCSQPIRQIPLSEMKIEIFKKKRDKEPIEIEIMPYLSSNPIEYQENFYRLEKGKWFIVHASRFDSIINILRLRKISSDSLGLPLYDLKDFNSTNKEYKELYYNKNVVKTLSPNALLLDRENIRLDKNSKNIFEFCDVILKKDDDIYIIHNKRAEVRQLSHLREQVERTGDFLATEFNKKSNNDFFFNIILKNFEKKSKSIKTQGDIFQSLQFESNQKGEDDKVDIFSRILSKKIQNQNFTNFVKQLKDIFPKEDYDFLISHQEKIFCFFDRFLDHYEEHKKNIQQEVVEFLESLKSAVYLQETLFPNGPCTQQNLTKIHIVLAVIDDRKADKAFEREKKLKDPENNSAKASSITRKKQLNSTNTPIFNKQDLWGLDKTRIAIEKDGFGFHIVVINEEKTEDFDAFGEIVKAKTTPYKKKGDALKINRTLEKEFEKTEESLNEADLKPNQTKKSLKQYFETAAADEIDTQEIQKIEYKDKLDEEEGLYPEYITCPTKGDGDCFFHAVFTDSGESTEKVQNRAANMRNEFVEKITLGDFSSHMGHLFYEHLSELYSTGQKTIIPTDTLEKFDANSEFQELQARFRQGRSKLENHLPREFFQEFDRKFVYSEEQIKEEFLQQDINKFIEPLRKVGGANTFIPVRKDMKCPAEIIAEENDANINVFTFNQKKQSLDLYKSIRGSDEEGQIVNVLLEGSHFMRLQGQHDSDDQFRQAIQIMKNSGIKEFEKTVWTEMDTSKRNYNEALMDQAEDDSSIMTNGESSKRKKLKTINSEIFKNEEENISDNGRNISK